MHVGYILSSLCLRWSQFCQLSIRGYVFSAYHISFDECGNICTYHIIIIKSEIWFTSQCLGSGHETMGRLQDTQNYGLRIRRECLERFPRQRLQRKSIVNDPGMHHGTCVTHVPWCMSGSLTRGGGENVPGIPGACATRNFTYLTWGPWYTLHVLPCSYGRKYLTIT